MDLRNNRSAKTFFKEALEIKKECYGSNHQDIFFLLLYLVLVCGPTPPKEEATYVEQLAPFVTNYNLEKGSLKDARAKANLALMHGQHGKLEGELQMLKSSLVAFEKNYDGNYPEIARTLLDLGNVMLRLDDFDMSKGYTERALEIYRKLYPSGHPETSRGLFILATIFKSQSDLNQANIYLNDALTLQKKICGDENEQYARILATLCDNAFSMGKKEAHKNYEMQALSVFEKIFGRKHPDSAKVLISLALACGQLGDVEGTISHSKEALEILMNYPSTNIQFILEALLILVDNCTKLSSMDQAFVQNRVQKAYEIILKKFGQNHPFYDKVLLIQTLMALKTIPTGKPTQSDSISPEQWKTLNLKATELFRNKDFKEALKGFHEALAVFESSGKDNDQEKAILLSSIGSCYRDLNQLEQAVATLEQCYALRVKFLNETDPLMVRTREKLADCREKLEQSQIYQPSESPPQPQNVSSQPTSTTRASAHVQTSINSTPTEAEKCIDFKC